MQDDFLTRVQQYQFNTNMGLPMDASFGNASMSMFTGGINPQNSDIWTQAAELEGRYKNQLQIAASVNPFETTKVMNDFMNEALDLLFSSLNQKQNPKVGTSSSYSAPSSASSATNSAETNTPVSKEGGSNVSANSVSTPESSKTTSTQGGSETQSETTVRDSGDKAGKNVKLSDTAKKYISEIDTKLDGENKVAAQEPLTKALNDKSLSLNERMEIFAHYKSKYKEMGMTDATTWREEAFAKEVHDKIKNDPSYKIDDVIKDLKQLDGFAGSDKKGIQKHLASYYADSANFAADFYLKAQKEGKLSQALEIVPPTESIQKRLSLGKETKAITELFKQLDDNVSPNAETKAKKYGITEERAKELDARFEEITRGWNKRATCGEALSITIFPEIFEKGNYTDKEKLYLLSVVHEHSGTKKNYTSTIEDFTKVFRAMSSADEEKYFPEILKLYGKI